MLHRDPLVEPAKDSVTSTQYGSDVDTKLLPARADHEPEGSERSGRDAPEWKESGTRWPNEATQRKGPWLGTALLSVAILMAVGWLYSGSAVESNHPEWSRVSTATAASTPDSVGIVQVESNGTEQVVPAIEVSYRDIDRGSTRTVRTALFRGDLVTATKNLQAAQGLDPAAALVELPDLTTNAPLQTLLKDRSNELFEVHLYDCCDEDGDVVEVLVNEAPFATVPIHHQGTIIAIPLHRGMNSIGIRGVADGGGGITVGFRTSRGDFYCGAMTQGQEHRLGVVVK